MCPYPGTSLVVVILLGGQVCAIWKEALPVPRALTVGVGMFGQQCAQNPEKGW